MRAFTTEELHIRDMGVCMPVRRRGTREARHRIVGIDFDRLVLWVTSEEIWSRGDVAPAEGPFSVAEWTVDGLKRAEPLPDCETIRAMERGR